MGDSPLGHACMQPWHTAIVSSCTYTARIGQSTHASAVHTRRKRPVRRAPYALVRKAYLPGVPVRMALAAAMPLLPSAARRCNRCVGCNKNHAPGGCVSNTTSIPNPPPSPPCLCAATTAPSALPDDSVSGVHISLVLPGIKDCEQTTVLGQASSLVMAAPEVDSPPS